MKLAVIGTGQMGQALVKGFIKAGVIQAQDILVYDKDEQKMRDFANLIGSRTCADGPEAVHAADYVLLAVKPQICRTVLSVLKAALRPDHVLISIMAGIPLEHLQVLSEGKPALVRVMPNLPAVVDQGVSALCFHKTSDDQEQFVLKLFSACGYAFATEEKLMDAVTGLSGSGPAYAMMMIEALADGGVVQGLPRDQAIKMAAMTLKGAAQMVLELEKHPAEFKDQVCSPGGTAIAAVRVLESKGMRSALIEAVDAASQRAHDLRNIKTFS